MGYCYSRSNSSRNISCDVRSRLVSVASADATETKRRRTSQQMLRDVLERELGKQEEP